MSEKTNETRSPEQIKADKKIARARVVTKDGEIHWNMIRALVDALNVGAREQLARALVRELPTGTLDDLADEMKRAAYHAEIRNLAASVKDAIKSGEITDAEGLDEWIHQTIDGHHDVIHTYAAQGVIRASDNDDAMIDEMGAEQLVKDDAINWSGLAFFAMRADLVELLAAEGIPVGSEPEEWQTEQPCADCKGTHLPGECPNDDEGGEGGENIGGPDDTDPGDVGPADGSD